MDWLKYSNKNIFSTLFYLPQTPIEPKKVPVLVKTPKQEVIPPNQQVEQQFSEWENPQSDPDEVVEYIVEDFSIICADSFEKLEDPQVVILLILIFLNGNLNDFNSCFFATKKISWVIKILNKLFITRYSSIISVNFWKF